MVQVGAAGLLVEDTICGPIRALPSEGSLAVLESISVGAGGCAANVAIALAKQAISVDVCGCMGNDSAADTLLTAFEVNRVGHANVVQLDTHQTSKTVVLLIEGQDRRYLHLPGANQAFTTEHIAREWIDGLKVFYLGGLFALPGLEFSALATLLEYCRAHDVVTVVDVVVPEGVFGMGDFQSLLPLIDVFLPNDDEARAFSGRTDPFDQLEVFCGAGANTVIITRGALGTVARRADKIWSCGAYQMNVIDPSGSGDAFTSGVIRSLLMKWDMPQLLHYASAVGASATRAAGTTQSVFSAREADAFVESNPLMVVHGH